MQTLEIALPYGHGQVTVELEADRFLGYLDPSPALPLEDRSAALREAIRRLFGAALDEMVGRGDKILLMTVDVTRPCPSLLVEILRQELDALGAKVDVMIGLGTHRPMTMAEERVGKGYSVLAIRDGRRLIVEPGNHRHAQQVKWAR